MKLEIVRSLNSDPPQMTRAQRAEEIASRYPDWSFQRVRWTAHAKALADEAKAKPRQVLIVAQEA